MKSFSPEEITARLTSLANWQLEDNGIQKEFVFADFSEAFAFLTRIAMLSEKMNHHAEWSGVYNKVRIHLTTHDAGGVTDKDLKMADALERFAGAASGAAH